MKIRPVDAPACRLGEGPLWDAPGETLYWVDSLAARLYRYRARSGESAQFDLPGKSLGSLAVRADGGLLLAMDQGFYAFDPDSGRLEAISLPLAGSDGLRFNDGKVDPFGAFVTGAMNIDPLGAQDCAMYRLTPEFEVERILDGFQCFNGPCFDADGKRLYVTGRSAGAIEVFDYAQDRPPSNGRVLIAGLDPDGATVDADGFLWSAQWADACVLRISPAGEIERRIDVPGQVVTSVMFGGPELEQIYLTTLGTDYYGASARGEQAGMLLVIDDSGYRGRAEPRFRG